MPFYEEHAEAVWYGPNFGESEEGEKACPYECGYGTGGWISAGEDVEEWKESKSDGPDVHACVVRLGVVETPQDVRHGEEPEEDGKRTCEREQVSDRRRLL